MINRNHFTFYNRDLTYYNKLTPSFKRITNYNNNVLKKRNPLYN